MTFLLLEPVLNNWLYPEEEPQTVTFPQEKDEMLPEDMLTEGETGTQTESETETAEQEQHRLQQRRHQPVKWRQQRVLLQRTHRRHIY